ncbi:hypothetical protein DSO57_1000239 [Entomophthora muscae]|uniref:Uncharacterized protein n=3 Tax=Entomophthora muscae TaxID=34485 RepID=A0ACC2SEF1_9FUNG|nr:hypothetical protein DSO57_1028299 [Entomophthora muscae]KAJ9067503.1 hypothetical protein DSO57_1038504 [Entomophthora muscae]KAJ9082943.1 hypothetical protein DSO57_1000239 [Entomophthora muscae]
MYILPTPTHTQIVQRLYKRSLLLARDWIIDYRRWRVEAITIRQRFEANRMVQDPKRKRALLDKAEDELQKFAHPNPYIYPTAPEGSKWERYGVQKPIFFKSTYKE